MNLEVIKPWGAVTLLCDVRSIDRNVHHPSLGVQCTAIRLNSGAVHYVDERMNTLNLKRD